MGDKKVGVVVVQPGIEIDVINDVTVKSFRNGMTMNVDAEAGEVGVFITKEVRDIQENTGDGDEGDDEDGMRDSSYPLLEVVLTGCK